MGFINLSDKTISAKLVYYGVGMGGKTTSLQAVHGVLCPRDEVQLVSINTEDDSTLLFDFLPIGLFYQALISVLAGVAWLLVVRHAWPANIEAWADSEQETPNP